MLKANAENTKKTYRAIIRSERKLDKTQFIDLLNELKSRLENQIIEQRTPIRVSHRRADKFRKKKIYSILGFFKKADLYEFIIETQGGTYIKELISGDNGRTKPSFTDIFGINLQCEELDVLKIY
jgi:tRNA pseudouridine synthase 10